MVGVSELVDALLAAPDPVHALLSAPAFPSLLTKGYGSNLGSNLDVLGSNLDVGGPAGSESQI